MTKDNVIRITKDRLLKLSLNTLIDELFGVEITKEWQDVTDSSSLEPIKEGEEAFDFELEEWEKKVFQITEILWQHCAAITKEKEGKIQLTEQDQLDGKKVFSYDQLAKAFRGLLWAILPLRHPELIGSFAYGIRTEYKVVKVPMKNLIKSNLITDPMQIQELLKTIKPPGEMN